MVSLWGSKKDDAEDGGGPPRDSEERYNRPTSSEHEPTERTRLLQQRPPPPRSDGYLDPDDPAVRLSEAYLIIANTRLGLPLQSVDSPLSPLHHHPLPRHNLCMVGSPPGLHLRLSARDALAG